MAAAIKIRCLTRTMKMMLELRGAPGSTMRTDGDVDMRMGMTLWSIVASGQGKERHLSTRLQHRKNARQRRREMRQQEDHELQDVRSEQSMNRSKRNNSSPTAQVFNSSDALVVTRAVEWGTVILGYEQANKYTVVDGTSGNPIAYIAEDNVNIGSFLSRQMFNRRRPFSATVLDTNGQVLFRARRPLYLINSTIFVEDANGNVFGEVIQRFSLTGRNYDLYINKEQFCAIRGGFLTWEFNLLDETGETLAQIDRNFQGLGIEMFTDAGKYVIRFGSGDTDSKSRTYDKVNESTKEQRRIEGSPNGIQKVSEDYYLNSIDGVSTLDIDERMIALSAAISIDFDYFSQHSNGHSMLPFFMPMPMPMPAPMPPGDGVEGESPAANGPTSPDEERMSSEPHGNYDIEDQNEFEDEGGFFQDDWDGGEDDWGGGDDGGGIFDSIFGDD